MSLLILAASRGSLVVKHLILIAAILPHALQQPIQSRHVHPQTLQHLLPTSFRLILLSIPLPLRLRPHLQSFYPARLCPIWLPLLQILTFHCHIGSLVRIRALFPIGILVLVRIQIQFISCHGDLGDRPLHLGHSHSW